MPLLSGGGLSSINCTMAMSSCIEFGNSVILRKIDDSNQIISNFGFPQPELHHYNMCLASDLCPMLFDPMWSASVSCGASKLVDVRSSLFLDALRLRHGQHKSPAAAKRDRVLPPLRLMCSNLHSLHTSTLSPPLRPPPSRTAPPPRADIPVSSICHIRSGAVGGVKQVYGQGGLYRWRDVPVDLPGLSLLLSHATHSQAESGADADASSLRWRKACLSQHCIGMDPPPPSPSMSMGTSTGSSRARADERIEAEGGGQGRGGEGELASMCFTSPYGAQLLQRHVDNATRALQNGAYGHHLSL